PLRGGRAYPALPASPASRLGGRHAAAGADADARYRANLPRSVRRRTTGGDAGAFAVAVACRQWWRTGWAAVRLFRRRGERGGRTLHLSPLPGRPARAGHLPIHVDADAHLRAVL